MNSLIKLLVLCTFLTKNTTACENGFFPKGSELSYQYQKKNLELQNKSLSIIKEIENFYTPIFTEENKTLFIKILWDSPKLNAFATRDDNNNPVIKITNGLLQNSILSEDGLRLILCHEIGHFLGGAPKKPRGRSSKKSWSSAEGQADYYANAYCMKKLLKEISSLSGNKDQSEIESICKTETCKRIALASLNVAKVYASIDYYNSALSIFETDHNTVYQTIYSHPSPQCRLDTLIAALRCKNSTNLLFDIFDPISGACKTPEYRRPRCWYYPDSY